MKLIGLLFRFMDRKTKYLQDIVDSINAIDIHLQGKRNFIIYLNNITMQLGQGYFIIEISSNNSCIFIAAYDVESPESLLIELPEKRAEEIMKEFNNDYEGIASCL